MSVRGNGHDDLSPYVPATLRRWDVGRSHQRVDGTLVSADISGFTALSERLASYGREGAEELTVLLNDCFGGMIDIVTANGGDVLKFGGDALLILFTGAEHARRAASSCWKMRDLIEREWSTALVSNIMLGISQGMHSGTFDLHLVDAGWQELLVVGPGMSATVDCEGAADRGEIRVSAASATLLDEAFLGQPHDDGSRSLVQECELPPPFRPATTDDGASLPFVPSWLAEQAAAGSAAEHRSVTVAFLFFDGVDEILVEHGSEEVHRRLQQLADVVHSATDTYGTHWLASDVYAGGGKVILTAGAPVATGQDEDAAVRTLLDIMSADIDLRLRCGVNKGAVFMGDLGSPVRRTFTVMGDAVNLAARLMQKSTSGEMVASASVLDAVPSPLDVRELEPFIVKGKTEPINAAIVEGLRSSIGTERTDDAAQIPFVGRKAELAELTAAMDNTLAGSGKVVDLVGEPGVGKSRLVQELLRQYPEAAVVQTTGGLYSRNSPYFAMRLLLRNMAGVTATASGREAGTALLRWLGDVAPDLLAWAPLIAVVFDADVPNTDDVDRIDPEHRGAKVREVVVDLMERILSEPTVVLIEDAYWLDEASDDLLAVVSARISELPWLVLALRRVDTECFASRYGDAMTLHLGDLKAEDSRALAEAAINAGLGADIEQLDALADRDVGNPLFVIELVRAGVSAETPDSIEALVTARIDTLNPSDRRLLRESAVLGAVVDRELIALATGDGGLADPKRWKPLAGFLASDRTGALRFQHALYRDVAYEGLSFRRRQALHAQVGSVIENRAGEDWAEMSELLSLHFHAARDWKRSWRYSATAGERAQQKYANAEAANFLERALDVPAAGRPSAAEVARIQERLGDVLELVASFDRAAESFSLARRGAADAVSEVRLLRKQGVIRERRGDYTQALRWFGRGLKAVDGVDDRAQRLTAEGELCLAYSGVRFRQGKLQGSIDWAHRAEKIAHDIGDDRMLAHSSYLLMIGYGVLRRPEAEEHRDVALPLFEELGDLVGQANVLNNLGVDAKEAGDWTAALDYYERSRTARSLSGDVIGEATASLNIGETLSDQGRLDQAEVLLEDACRAFERAGYRVGVAVSTSYLARLRARQGFHDWARLLFDEALAAFEDIGASHFALETRVFALESAVLAGDGVAAVAESDELFRAADALGDDLLSVILMRVRAWALFQSRQFDEAATLVEEALGVARAMTAAFEEALLLILSGRISQARGQSHRDDHDRARSLLESLDVVSLPEIAAL